MQPDGSYLIYGNEQGKPIPGTDLIALFTMPGSPVGPAVATV